jgi:hypothetical protein
MTENQSKQRKYATVYRLILTASLFIFGISVDAQKSDGDRSDWIFWQNDRPLIYENFKGQVGSCGAETLEDSINIEVSACLGIWSVLDIPKSWKKGVEYERFYFAPVFNINKSWAKSNDSIAILKQQVYFDLTELATRWARKELYSLREQSGNATGSTAIYYATIEKKMREFKQGMYVSYFDDVFRTNSIDSLQSWIDLTSEMLEETIEYRTRDIEFERLISGKSEKGYKKAKKIVGPIKEN